MAELNVSSILNDTLNATATNIVEGIGSRKPPESIAGAIVAYGALFIMALVPIYFGARRSVRHLTVQRREVVEKGVAPEAMTEKDAMMFPVIASIALVSLYLLFYYFGKQYINFVLAAYFFIIGTVALGHFVTTCPSITCLVPYGTLDMFELLLVKKPRGMVAQQLQEEALPAERAESSYVGDTSALSARVKKTPSGSTAEDADVQSSTDDEATQSHNLQASMQQDDVWLHATFSYRDLGFYVASLLVGVFYMWQKHWIANNIFGLTFAIDGIELIQLNKMSIGCLLLGLLFFYDVFWVFGTDVMVTVARSFEAPIKVIFPQDFLTRGIFGQNFAMLGLGDIVLPGVFIGLMLRFDRHMLHKLGAERYPRNLYFNMTFLAYLLGLLTCIGVMHIFHHAQPALLYLVPACIGAPCLTALLRGELKDLFGYADHPEAPATPPSPPAVKKESDRAEKTTGKLTETDQIRASGSPKREAKKVR